MNKNGFGIKKTATIDYDIKPNQTKQTLFPIVLLLSFNSNGFGVKKPVIMA